MEIETVCNNGFDIAVLDGDLTIGTLSSLTPALTSLIKEHPDNNIVLDMSKVSSIDLCAVRLLENIKKKLDTSSRKLYILNPAEEQSKKLSVSSNDSPFQIIMNISELQKNVNTHAYQQFLPFTFQDGDFLRLRLSCGVCGSPNVHGYLLNKNDYLWKWPADDYFPECTLTSGETFDFFSLMPIVCSDCMTASVEIASFNLVDENSIIRHHSTFNDQIKLLLSKSLKKRKKLVEESELTIGDNFFSAPRNRTSTLYAYLLAESCSRIAAINYNDVNMFTVGYLNYIALLYCEKSMKSALIDSCRTFLTQVLSAPDRYNHVQLAQAYFIIFMSSLSLGKFKDISKIMESYTELMDQMGTVADSPNNIESPSFWFNRADEIWKNEISKKSSAISAD